LIATLEIGEVLIFTWFMPNFIADAPIQPEKMGDLNGSMQYLLEVLLKESRRLISFAGVNANKTKAPFTS
jgi:hypothetical protein